MGGILMNSSSIHVNSNTRLCVWLHCHFTFCTIIFSIEILGECLLLPANFVDFLLKRHLVEAGDGKAQE